MIHCIASLSGSVLHRIKLSVVWGLATLLLLAGGAQAANAQLSVAVGTTSATQTATVSVTSPAMTASTTASAISVVTQGAAGLDFNFASGGTCAVSTTYQANFECTIKYTFKPQYSGLRFGAVELKSTAGVVMGTALISGVGTGPQPIFPQATVNTLPGTYSQPRSIALDGAGNAYIANFGNANVLKVPVGCTTSACVTTLETFSGPASVAVDGAGNVYVADFNLNEVLKILANCTSECVSTLGGGFNEPIGIAVDGSGNVFVADFANNQVKVIAPGCTSASCVEPLGNGFSNPQDIAVDASGTVYIADYGNSLVKSMPANCNSFVGCTITTLGGGFSSPSGVAVDGNGNVYVGDSGNNAVEVMTPGCTPANASTCVTTLNGTLSGPIGVTLDGGGNVYVADNGNNAIRELPRATAAPLNFGSVNDGGTSAQQTVTLTNYGNLPLTFPVPSTGVNPSFSSGFAVGSVGAGACPNVSAGGSAGTLAANASCALNITFAPLAPDNGAVTGSATLTDNSAGVPGPTQTIALSGTATDVAPVITSISPTDGLPAGGTTVTVNGTILNTITSVNFGGTVTTNFHIVSESQLTVVSPAEAVGVVDIQVQNPDKLSAKTTADQFTYSNTLLNAITFPALANAALGTTPPTPAATATSGQPVTYSSSTPTVCTIAGSAITDLKVGTCTIAASQSAAGHYAAAATVSQSFQVIAAPTVTGVSPSSGPLVGTTVTITGTDFGSGATVSFGGTAGNGVTVISATSLTVSAPAHAAGTVHVTVTVSGATSVTSANDQFTYAPPTVTGVSPSSGITGGGETVNITGTNFGADSQVIFGGVAATSTYKNSGLIVATSPGGFVGTVDVTVTSGGVTSVTNSADHYTFLVPTVTGVSPSSGLPSGGTVVTITGTGFSGDVLPYFGNNVSTEFFINGPTSITATTPAGASGTVDVTIQANGGTSATSAADHFTYGTLPTVTGVSPLFGPPAGGTSVTITGTGFASGATVSFGGKAATGVVVNSSTSITAVAPSGSGSVDVTVTGAAGTSQANTSDEFGYFILVNVGSTSATQTATVTMTTAGTLGAIDVLTTGQPNLDYAFVTGGTCATGTAYAANATCTVKYSLKPRAPGIRNGAVQLIASGGTSVLGTTVITGLATGPAVMYPTNQSLAILGSGFNQPYSMAVDAAGNVYVADFKNNAVKEILAADGSVLTLGSGFASPTGVAVDGAGNVYVADFGHGALKEMRAVGGSVPTSNPQIATLGPGKFIAPLGVTVDGAGNVYLTDAQAGTVWEIVASTGSVNALGTTFSNPHGIAVDAFGNVFVADFGNNAVKEIVGASGAIVTVGPAFTTPNWVAIDAAGDVYVADAATGTVSEMVAVNGSIPSSSPTVLTLGPGFTSPTGLALDEAGNVYIADNGPNTVYKLATATPPSFTFAATSVGSTSAAQSFSLQNFGNEDLVLSVPGSGKNPAITSGFTLNAASNCPLVSAGGSTVALAEGGFCTESISFKPVTAGSDIGSLTFTDNALNVTSATQAISLIGSGGTPTVTAVSPASGPATGGTAVTITGTNFVTGATVSFGTTAATNVTVISATQITALSPAGSVGVADVTVTSGGGTSATVTADRFTYTAIASTITFPALANTVIGATPPVLKATSNAPTPITYSSTTPLVCTVALGVVTDLAGGTCSITASQVASGIYAAATPVSQSYTVTVPLLFIAGSGSVGSLAGNGNITSSATSGGGIGAAVDSTGFVWSIDASGTGISRFTSLGAKASDFTSVGLVGASALAIDGNSQVWVANSNGTVTVLSSVGTAVSTTQGSTTAAPTGIAIDISGNVWITNNAANSVDEVIGGAVPTSPLSTSVTKNTTGARP
ncbi:IPT/TIG domain-containing protein [Granulicella tundricola]|uniref:Cell surface receptor IPT/TIG domain protein n=1 Tax=Granulicella tundricola (strain ATCC BAA-1859 / DSM 23138 / MP5ACTX9) TaxID=1198114 RepID=E8X2J1_GRATM|nr:IPT/TIG domain-containing protein [Granulicella tundricola]ADW69215.1 cell surface receptor IPT/TIG domain protein [Granulicella tundricola MP5ACTX9]